MIVAPGGLTAATPAGLAAAVVFAALLVAACVTDLRQRRIPNGIVAMLLVGGLTYTVCTTWSFGAVGRSLLACALGFAIWIPFYAFRMLGAGDVKLFAAGAIWLVPSQVLQAALYSALFGGLLSVLWLVLEYGASRGIARAAFLYTQPLSALTSTGRVGGDVRRHIPYGIAITLGLCLVVWLTPAA
jgi:prepilin peptidase CpaA